jgi:hypothetical protein
MMADYGTMLRRSLSKIAHFAPHNQASGQSAAAIFLRLSPVPAAARSRRVKSILTPISLRHFVRRDEAIRRGCRLHPDAPAKETPPKRGA